MTANHGEASGAVDEWRGGSSSSRLSEGGTSNLADILERVLDKGVVIAGDISISLVDVELLTIKLRLLIASVDKAREMGINWWENDPWLTTGSSGEVGKAGDTSAAESNHGLEERFGDLEQIVERLAAAVESTSRAGRP